MAGALHPSRLARRRGLRRLKYEVARDLGLADDIEERGWGNMTTREVGTIGGRMVRRLVRRGERDLSGPR